jgi:hypothetical protein
MNQDYLEEEVPGEEDIDELQQYQEEMQEREQNIIQSFLYVPESGQKNNSKVLKESTKSHYFQDNGLNTQNYSNINNNEFLTQVNQFGGEHFYPETQNYSDHNIDVIIGHSSADDHYSGSSMSGQEYTVVVDQNRNCS